MLRVMAPSIVRPIAGWMAPPPSYFVDFLGAQTGGLAVTRSGSNATYFGSDGARGTAAANTPRIDHNPATLARLGLLREPQRTNLCLYSDDRSNVAWYASDVTIDGTDTIVEAATSGVGHGIVASVSLAGATLYTYSEYLAPLGRRYAQLFADPGDANLNTWATFDLQDGVVTEDGSAVTSAIRPGPDGSWLCSMTFTTPGSPSNPYVGVFASPVADPGAYPIYAGNGAAAIRARGAQVEAGHCPTSRIATTSGSVSRSADSIVLSGTIFNQFWRSTEGTILVDFLMQDTPLSSELPAILSINDNTASERFNVLIVPTSPTLRLAVVDGGVSQATCDVGTPAYDGTLMRFAGAWRLNDVRSAASGGTLSTGDTSATLPTVTQIEVGAQNGGLSANTPIWFQRIAYWGQRLPDDVIAGLTR